MASRRLNHNMWQLHAECNTALMLSDTLTTLFLCSFVSQKTMRKRKYLLTSCHACSRLCIIVANATSCARTKGRFFYQMPAHYKSEWIFTQPEADAPRTGDGVFPMDVIEVTQVRSTASRLLLTRDRLVVLLSLLRDLFVLRFSLMMGSRAPPTTPPLSLRLRLMLIFYYFPRC